jgi:tetratricopeptide (TPR) repeat protein
VLPLDPLDEEDDDTGDDDVVLDSDDGDEAESGADAPAPPATLPAETSRLSVLQARQSGDRRQQGEQLTSVAQALAGEGKHNEALAAYTEALAAYEAVNDAPGILSTLHALAELEVKTDNLQAAVLHASRGITLAHDYDNVPARIRSLTVLGDARQELGESEDAIRAYETALELIRGLEDEAGQASLLLKLGYAQLDTGDSAQAVRTWDEALDKARTLGLRSLEARALGGIGTAKGEMGHWTEAVGFFSSALHIAREAGDTDEEATELGNLAYAHIQENQLGKAVLRYRQALHLAYLSGNKAAIIGTTVDLARLFVEVPQYMKLAELIVDHAMTLDAHDVDLRRLKERIEDELDALGDDVNYKPVGGTAQQYAANAYALEG